LLVSPERLANERFRSRVLDFVADRIALLVIDEAHCISDWGHDFRPHYRLVQRVAETLPPNLRLLATTATANKRVMDDLAGLLGPNLEVLRGDLNRPSLVLQTIRLRSQAERLAWLAENIGKIKGTGIIYTLTIRDARQVASWLRQQGFNVEAYTSRTGEQREELEQALLANRLKALVATTALGMGFDKPDLAFVIHYQAPGSVVTYYQQVGRAGREIETAYGVLLSGDEDTMVTSYFIETAFPTPDEVSSVLEALAAEPGGLSLTKLFGRVNLSEARVKKTIELLSLEFPAPIVKIGSKWQVTPARLKESFWKRVQRLTALRCQEQRQMQQYIELPFGEHMRFLIAALDGDVSTVAPPKRSPLPTEVSAPTVRAAVTFLRRASLPIVPRRTWPVGGMPLFGVAGRIPTSQRAQRGRALCVWADSGWGHLVRRGKYRDHHFSDELVDACVQLVREWSPTPTPKWLTCIPSLRYPDLVPDFARRLADNLELPFYEVFEKTKETPEQKDMANRVQQAYNIDGSLSVRKKPLPEPVLLVDDMVDSRWTLTVAAWLLLTNGSGPVFPLVLAHAGDTRWIK